MEKEKVLDERYIIQLDEGLYLNHICWDDNKLVIITQDYYWNSDWWFKKEEAKSALKYIKENSDEYKNAKVVVLQQVLKNLED